MFNIYGCWSSSSSALEAYEARRRALSDSWFADEGLPGYSHGHNTREAERQTRNERPGP